MLKACCRYRALSAPLQEVWLHSASGWSQWFRRNNRPGISCRIYRHDSNRTAARGLCIRIRERRCVYSAVGCSDTLPSLLLFWGSIGGQKWVPLLQVVCVLWWRLPIYLPLLGSTATEKWMSLSSIFVTVLIWCAGVPSMLWIGRRQGAWARILMVLNWFWSLNFFEFLRRLRYGVYQADLPS